jgi:hypothetical protein
LAVRGVRLRDGTGRVMEAVTVSHLVEGASRRVVIPREVQPA